MNSLTPRATLLAVLLTLPVAALVAQAEQQARVPGAPPHAAALAAALKYGELYDNILRDAWAGDSNAIGFFLAYACEPEFREGAAAAEHAAVVVALLKHVGDSAFAIGLRGESTRVQRIVISALDRTAPGLVTDVAYPRTSQLRSATPRPRGR